MSGRARILAGLDIEAALAAAVLAEEGAAAAGPDGRVLVAGMDEVGRGALAGPVVVGVAAAWVRPSGRGDEAAPGRGAGDAPPPPVRDSKALSDARRRALVPEIHDWAAAACTGGASPQEIDRWGITGALALAGRRAWAAVCSVAGATPAALILDGSDDWTRHARRGELARLPLTGSGCDGASSAAERGGPAGLDGPVAEMPTPVMQVKAEDRCATVAAASIVAKVGRDDLMVDLARSHPDYGWDANKGYGAAVHRAALARIGTSEHHRRSWNLGVPDDAPPTLFD